MRISDWSSDGCSSDLAGRGAAADLVLPAGPRAVAEHAVLAAAQLEQPVHQVERPTHRHDARVRAAVAPGAAPRSAVSADPRPRPLGVPHVGVATAAAPQTVVARLQRVAQLRYKKREFR